MSDSGYLHYSFRFQPHTLIFDHLQDLQKVESDIAVTIAFALSARWAQLSASSDMLYLAHTRN